MLYNIRNEFKNNIMTVKELKEKLSEFPDNAIIASLDCDDTSINSEIKEIGYLFTATKEKGNVITEYIILG